jgi:SAM-dependent methyltransferase
MQEKVVNSSYILRASHEEFPGLGECQGVRMSKVSDDFNEGVERHWYDGESGQLLKRIEEALREDGKDLENLTLDDLMAVDEFHIRGREATTEMAELAALKPDERVIDVGSGIGGPSRFLASTFGCRVTGIDLTSEYCEVANALAQRVGLEERVSYQQANALAIPFEDESFDVAWTQHISMNIQDKQAFFKEMRRVVRPGGRLVIYDPIQGDGAALDFPVPWSRDGDINFLINAEETRRVLEGLDLEITRWQDASQKSVDWFAANAQRGQDLKANEVPIPAAPPRLGLNVLLGGDWPIMAGNMVENLKNGRLAVVQVIAQRN